MNELSVAVVGCGNTGILHLGGWIGVPGVTVKALCDADGSAAAAAANHLPGAAAFTELASLLKSDEFDIVDICSPPDTHESYSIAALRAGANVLCELPVTGSSVRCARIVQAAENRERIFMPAVSYRVDELAAFGAALLQNDDIGSPTMFRCRFSGKAELPGVYDGESMRGALLQVGINGIDLFRFLCGDVGGAVAELGHPTSGAEERVALLLRGENGAIGVVEADWNSTGERNIVEVYGTAGACIIDYDTGVLRYLTADHPVWRTMNSGGPNRIVRIQAHFADSVRGFQPPIAKGGDAVEALRICAELYGGVSG